MNMGVDYMQAVEDSLNKTFHNLPMFNACKLFRSITQPRKRHVSMCVSDGWKGWHPNSNLYMVKGNCLNWWRP